MRSFCWCEVWSEIIVLLKITRITNLKRLISVLKDVSPAEVEDTVVEDSVEHTLATFVLPDLPALADLQDLHPRPGDSAEEAEEAGSLPRPVIAVREGEHIQL